VGIRFVSEQPETRTKALRIGLSIRADVDASSAKTYCLPTHMETHLQRLHHINIERLDRFLRTLSLVCWSNLDVLPNLLATTSRPSLRKSWFKTSDYYHTASTPHQYVLTISYRWIADELVLSSIANSRLHPS
jgi:hypothetical protein